MVVIQKNPHRPIDVCGDFLFCRELPESCLKKLFAFNKCNAYIQQSNNSIIQLIIHESCTLQNLRTTRNPCG